MPVSNVIKKVGTKLPDFLTLTLAEKAILGVKFQAWGKDGNDKIVGFCNDDTLDGGKGDDCLDGGDGNDKLFGGDGNDKIDGGKGDDCVDGGSGDDCIVAGCGNDVVFAGAGNDKVFGGDGKDYADGGAGCDELFGGDDCDVLIGGAGNDFLHGGQGADKQYGGAGNDKILFGASDQLSSGTGKDILVLADETEGCVEVCDYDPCKDVFDFSCFGSIDICDLKLYGNKLLVDTDEYCEGFELAIDGVGCAIVDKFGDIACAVEQGAIKLASVYEYELAA